MIRLVALDLDGTLLDSQGLISNATRQTIQQVRRGGIKVVLCTGRPFYSLAPLLSQLELTGAEEYVISFNGALLSDAQGGQVLFEQPILFEDYQAIKALSEQLQLAYHVQSQKGIYTSNATIDPHTAYDSYLNQAPIHCVTDAHFQHIPIYKMMFVGTEDKLKRAIKQIPETYAQRFNMMQSLDCFFEFLHPQASKGQTLQRLAEYLAIHPSEILAIGDNENDLSMLEFAGISVAMGNAAEQIKKNADYVTKTNEEEGVRHSLLQLLKTWVKTG